MSIAHSFLVHISMVVITFLAISSIGIEAEALKCNPPHAIPGKNGGCEYNCAGKF